LTGTLHVLSLALVIAASQPCPALAQSKLGAAEAADIAEAAYIYGYPLVTMEMTRRVMTNVAAPSGNLAPTGRFAHLRSYPTPADKAVTTPNADTLYSSAWLDLGREPMILTLPEANGRFYLMPILSGWTDVLEAPGTRTTGTGRQIYALTGPRWKGTLPEGITELKSPTSLAWILGRTYCKGTPEDYKAVHQFQNQVTIVPLSAYDKPYAPPAARVDSGIDMKTPVRDQVNRMEASAFFKLLAALLKDNPPSEADAPMIASMARVGIVPGKEFDATKLDGVAAPAIASAPQRAWKRISTEERRAEVPVSGWSYSTDTGAYGNDYLRRATIAAFGLGANLPEDAVYPRTRVDAEGHVLTGRNRYVIRFPMGETPPVNAFWSLTMYDPSYFFVSNYLNRYSLGDRSTLRSNEDGSLDLYVQHESPGRERESNWLPAPSGEFSLMLRLYWPTEDVIDGSWKPPAVIRADRLEATHEIKELGRAFVGAYSKGDAEGIAALFTEDAEAADETGAVIRGRDAIRGHFASVFAEKPGEKIELSADSITFLGPDLARESGRSRTISPKNETSEVARYDVLLVRSNSHWLHASVREIPETGLTPHDRLKELEWMVGEWVDESDEGVVRTSCRWSDDQNFLIREFRLHVGGRPALSGSQRIGWDPLTGQFKSWVFDADGGHSEGLWSRSGESQWTIRASGVLADGQAVSGTQVVTYVNNSQARWQSVDRSVGGKSVPDLPEIVLVRTPPKPVSSAAKPK
jgi:uncharacterized protein (TIGR02246 family)